jgi:methylmalonyl-CoA/ethylmalonyl-CoA epimerase
MAAKLLDHIGMVVDSIEATAERIESVLGFHVEAYEDYDEGLITIAFIPLGQGLSGPKIELLEPHRPGCSAWDYLKAHGNGVEHLAFLVDDVDRELSQLRQSVSVLDATGRPGAGHMTIAFLHPDAIPGIWVELVALATGDHQ